MFYGTPFFNLTEFLNGSQRYKDTILLGSRAYADKYAGFARIFDVRPGLYVKSHRPRRYDNAALGSAKNCPSHPGFEKAYPCSARKAPRTSDSVAADGSASSTFLTAFRASTCL